MLTNVRLPEPMLSPGLAEATMIGTQPPCLRATDKDGRRMEGVITIGQWQMNIMIICSLIMAFMFFVLIVATNQ